MSQFELLNAPEEARRAAIAADLAGFYAEMSGPQKKEPPFNLARLVNKMNSGELSGTYEGGVCQKAAIEQGREWRDPRSQIVPWAALMNRGLSVDVPSRGGNLIGSSLATPMDVLRQFSVTMRMGVSTVAGLTQNLLLPSTATATTAQWLADETSAITSTDPVIGQFSSTPKTAGALIAASFQFMKQAATADEVIRQQLLGAVGQAIDQAVLAGSGASGQPLGLLLAPGVNEQSGEVFNTSMLDALETLALANSDDANIKFLTTPAIRRILQARPVEAGAWPMIWRENQVVDKPAFVTTDCPTGTIFAGDWSKVLVAFWGSGIEIVVDPYTNFKTGAIQVRAMVSADVIVTKPAAMLRHTSFS